MQKRHALRYRFPLVSDGTLASNLLVIKASVGSARLDGDWYCQSDCTACMHYTDDIPGF